MFDWIGAHMIGFCGYYGNVWWAIVDDTAMLAIALPCRWGMGPKHDRKVLHELGSNRSMAHLNKSWIEDMSRTNSGHKYVMSILSFVNGHFTGKRHWDCLDLVPILFWFLFCPCLGLTLGIWEGVRSGLGHIVTLKSAEFWKRFRGKTGGLRVVSYPRVNTIEQPRLQSAQQSLNAHEVTN